MTPHFRHGETEISVALRDLHMTDKIYTPKYPFIPCEKDGEEGEGSGGETSDKHRCGRTKSHLILREKKREEEERRCETRGDK